MCRAISPVLICIVTVFALVNCEYEGNPCRVLSSINGTCISIYQCPKALQAFDVQPLRREMVDYLRQLQCGFKGHTPLVCCSDQIDVNSIRPSSFKPLPSPNKRPPSRIPGQSLLPSRDECGRGSFPDRIYNGKICEIDEFPWMVLLGYRNGNGNISFECGGVLISKRYVLTAAHCVVGAVNQAVGRLEVVRLGEYDLQTDRDCTVQYDNQYEDCADPVIDIRVEEIIPHVGFSDRNINRQDDIALIRLSSDVRYSDFIQPICLPSSERFNPSDEDLTVAGWGRTDQGRKSNIKLKLVLPFFDKQKCVELFETANAKLTPNQICAGGEYAKDACNGDSGGPLMIRVGDTWISYGVVSFGNGCGREGWPGIYTDVSQYMPWIQSNIRT